MNNILPDDLMINIFTQILLFKYLRNKHSKNEFNQIIKEHTNSESIHFWDLFCKAEINFKKHL